MAPNSLPAFADSSMRSIQIEPQAVQPAGGTLRIPLNRSGYLVGGILNVYFDFAAPTVITPGLLVNCLAISRIRLSSAGTTDYFRLSGYSAGLLGATREGTLQAGDVASAFETGVAARYLYLNKPTTSRYCVSFNLRNILGELELFSLLNTEGTGGLVMEIDLAPAAGSHPMTGYTQATGVLVTERRLYPLTGSAPPYQGMVKTCIETVYPFGAGGNQDNFTLPQIGMVTGLWVYYRNGATGALVPSEFTDYQLQFGSISNPLRETGRGKLIREQMEEKFLLPTGVHRWDFLAGAGDTVTMPHTRDAVQVVDATDVRCVMNFDAAFTTWAPTNERVVVQEVLSPAYAE